MVVSSPSSKNLIKPLTSFGTNFLLESVTNLFVEDEDKLMQIKSSVNLPFYSFSSKEQETKQAIEQAPGEPSRLSDAQLSEECLREPVSTSKSEDVIMLESDHQAIKAPEEPNGQLVASVSSTKLEDIICLDSDSNDDEPADSLVHDQRYVNTNDQVALEPELVVLDEDEDEDEDEKMSLSDLSSSFQKCLQPMNQNQASNKETESEEAGSSKFKPFDYEAARNEVKFGRSLEKEQKTGDISKKNSGTKKGAVPDRSEQDELLPQGKRRQAFPASGNRSATFR